MSRWSNTIYFPLYSILLLQAGGDPNARDLDEWTPLHAAAHWGQKEACRLLADYGADFTLRNHVVCIIVWLATLHKVQIYSVQFEHHF